MLAHRAIWAVAVGEASALTPGEETTLELIARLPLLPARHVEALLGAGSPAAVYRRVAHLRLRGLVAMIDGPRDGNGRRPGLLLVENLGLAVLAHRHDLRPEALARSYRLHRRALDRLALGLPAALASYELLALVTRAVGRLARLQNWQRPWRWAGLAAPGNPQVRRRRVNLPAYAAVDWEHRGAHFEAGFIIVADTGGLTPSVLQPQLAQLSRMLRSTGVAGPVVAIATTSERRAQAWLGLFDRIASNRHGAALEATVATWEAWRTGCVGPRLGGLVDEGVSAITHGDARSEKQPRPWSRIPSPISLTRVRASVAVWHMSAGARAALDIVGRHAFLPTATVGQVLGQTGRWARERRAELVRLGLLRIVRKEELPRGVGCEDALMELSLSGLSRLSASMGLSLAEAVRNHGLAGGDPDTPVGPRGALLAHLEHTLGADAIFAAIAASARRQRGGGLLEWRNAAACAHGRTRPDGYGLLRLGRQEYGFFLEFDRGTVRPAALRAKFAAYHRYQVSPRSGRDYDGFPTILVVTTGPGAEERLARAVRASDQGQASGLPVLLTTHGWLQSHCFGPLGPVWREPRTSSRHSWGR